MYAGVPGCMTRRSSPAVCVDIRTVSPAAVDDGDVGMRDAGGGARLVQDARLELAGRRRRAQALERDLPVEPRVVAEEDVAHAPDAQAAEHDVRADVVSVVDVGQLLGLGV